MTSGRPRIEGTKKKLDHFLLRTRRATSGTVSENFSIVFWNLVFHVVELQQERHGAERYVKKHFLHKVAKLSLERCYSGISVDVGENFHGMKVDFEGSCHVHNTETKIEASVYR